MRVPQFRTSQPVRRWTVLLLLSAAFHVALLSAFALRPPQGSRIVVIGAPDITVVQAPALVAWPQVSAAVPRIDVATRLVAPTPAPRFAGAPEASTGEASDTVDLFGPVFADGLWPRPVVVRSEPCNPEEPTELGDACRRELLLIGLASDRASGAKAQP